MNLLITWPRNSSSDTDMEKDEEEEEEEENSQYAPDTKKYGDAHFKESQEVQFFAKVPGI